MSTAQMGAREALQGLRGDCELRLWLQSQKNAYGEAKERRFYARPSIVGLALRTGPDMYILEPHNMELTFQNAVTALRSNVTMTMCSQITAALFHLLGDPNSQMQVKAIRNSLPTIENMNDLATAGASEFGTAFACLVKRDNVVLISANSTKELIEYATEVEQKLLAMVYGQKLLGLSQRQPAYQANGDSYGSDVMSTTNSISAPRPPMSHTASFSNFATPMNEKQNVFAKAFAIEDGVEVFDPNSEESALPPRKMALTRSFAVSLSLTLVLVIQGQEVATLLEEYLWDQKTLRFALVLAIPFFIAFTLFFVSIVVGAVFQLIGPVGEICRNTRFHSAKAPIPERHLDVELPHVTVQIPVYKEGLKGVIAPTIASIQAAVRFYESRGGTASIFICEDGMQVIQPELAEARKVFYEMNSIGWCARPPHKKDGYIRSGQFKKASNMNYAINFSIRVEQEFFRLCKERCHDTGCSEDDIVGVVESMLYKQALENMVKQDEGKTEAAGSLRIGEVILIVDSDTRVPVDCLLTGALEMHESPEVAILQHTSSVLKVTGSAFENGIAFFTDLVYTSIRFVVGSGDHAPFVGHNAFIRFKALQGVSFVEKDVRKFWADTHVSEDFELALKLQLQGWTVRLASYHGEDFKEGVSLTVFDEVSRWQKYAYGCNEIIFNPISKWYKGPITGLFWKFLWCDMNVSSKIAIFAYMSTYYAIGTAVPVTLANYLIVGWFPGQIDEFYINSWRTFTGIVVVFNLLAPFAFAAARHRLGQKKFVPAIAENAKWLPLFVLFFGGISLHVLKAILCHFFGISLEWGSTAKELEATGFFVGVDKIAKDYKFTYLITILITAGMIYLGLYAPDGWRITDWSAIVPLANQVACHFFLPILWGLN